MTGDARRPWSQREEPLCDRCFGPATTSTVFMLWFTPGVRNRLGQPGLLCTTWRCDVHPYEATRAQSVRAAQDSLF